jgi:hypothetical protein
VDEAAEAGDVGGASALAEPSRVMRATSLMPRRLKPERLRATALTVRLRERWTMASRAP